MAAIAAVQTHALVEEASQEAAQTAELVEMAEAEAKVATAARRQKLRQRSKATPEAVVEETEAAEEGEEAAAARRAEVEAEMDAVAASLRSDPNLEEEEEMQEDATEGAHTVHTAQQRRPQPHRISHK